MLGILEGESKRCCSLCHKNDYHCGFVPRILGVQHSDFQGVDVLLFDREMRPQLVSLVTLGESVLELSRVLFFLVRTRGLIPLRQSLIGYALKGSTSLIVGSFGTFLS